MTTKLSIAILQGGISAEHEVSLMSGAEIAKHIDTKQYDVTVITIGKDGAWYNETEQKTFTPIDYTKGVGSSEFHAYDVVFNALHGAFGEDGGLQSLLDGIGVLYTGSGVLASAWGMDKAKTNTIATSLGISIPKTIVLHRSGTYDIAELKQIFATGAVVKPNASGSSVATTVMKDSSDLQRAIDAAFSESEVILIQEYIRGRETTCAVIGNQFTDKTAYPVVEIVPKASFYDYEAKYKDDSTEYVCPAALSDATAKRISEQAKAIHTAIGADGLTRSDFIVTAEGEVYFLEINTAPGMTSHSLAPKAVAATGVSYSALLDMLISLEQKK